MNEEHGYFSREEDNLGVRTGAAMRKCQINIMEYEKAQQINKAVYTAALVADGWAGAENLEKF